MKRIFLIVIVVALGVVVFFAFREYNRTNKDLKNTSPDIITTVSGILAAFDKDSASFNKKYIDKVIAVSGVVKSIDQQENPVVIAMGNAGEMSSVQCSMDSTYANEYKSVKEGSQVTIKGLCTGARTAEMFGTDVILNRCILSESK
jgi:hypothetical protein